MGFGDVTSDQSGMTVDEFVAGAVPFGKSSNKSYGFGAVASNGLKGFGAVAYRSKYKVNIKPKEEPQPVYSTLGASSANVNMERRLEAAGVPVPEVKPKQGFFSKALDILDRPGAAVRSGVAALYQGKSAGEALSAAKQGFTGQIKTTGQDVIEAGAARGAPIFQNLKKLEEKSVSVKGFNIPAGRILGELAVDVALDPTTYITAGTKKVAETGMKALAGNIGKEVLAETGTKIARESAERLAANALKGEIPVGKLGTAINRALGYTAETKTIPTGFGKVAAAGKKIDLTGKAEEAAKVAATAKQTLKEVRATGDVAATAKATEASKGFAAVAKDLSKQAKTLKAGKTAATVTELAGQPGFAKTTMRVFGQPVLDLTPALKPIQTAAGALVERSPALTKVTDALGRVFSFNYTPTAIKGTERALITGAKERITQTVREIPFVRGKGMQEAGKAFKGISEGAAKEAPFVIEQTAKGTKEAQKTANIASDLFAKDVDILANQGIPLNTIDNYVQHIYTDPPERIRAIIAQWRRSAVPGATPSFTKRRSIPTLEEAQKLGLHPVTDVRQLTMVHRAMTEQAVSLQNMGRELIGMGKGVIQDSDPGGWRNVTSTAIPSLKGKWVHPEVARALDNLYPVIANTDEGVKVAGNIIDGAVRAWKALVLFRPGFHMRNFVGNVFLNMADGVFNPSRYPQAVAVLSGALKEVELGGRRIPTQVIRDWFAQHALQGQGMFREAAGGATKSLTKEAAETLAKLQRNGIQNVAYRTKRLVTHPFESSREFGEATDSLGRMANFLHHLDTGLSPSEAAAMTRKALFDYGALTPAEQVIRRYVAPFYAWTRFSIPRMFERMIGAPGLVTGTAHLRESMVNAQGIDEANLPQYLRDNQAIPLWVDDKGNIHYLTWNLPLTELSRIHDPRDITESWKEIAGMLNPLATIPVQLRMNRTLLTGQQITDYPELGGAPMLKDYAKFALSQTGMPREIANWQNQKEQQRLYEQAAEEGKPKEVPPTTKSLAETLSTMTTVQNPANWARSKIYQQQELLKEAIGAAKEQHVDIPDTEEIGKPGELKGFAKVSGEYGRGFAAVAAKNVASRTGNAPDVVRQAMTMSGVDPSWGPYMAILMRAESEGNPMAVNNQPINPLTGAYDPRGERATGLFQMLPSTFKEYAVEGHTDIFNPLDNTLADINYIKARYGHPANIPRLGRPGYKGH